MSAKIIAIAIEKGGVAKTVTATNLAALFAKDKKKVLMVDMDQQANTTTLMTGYKKGEGHFKGKGLFDMFRSYGLIETSNFIAPTLFSGIDIIPSTNNTPQIDGQLEMLSRSEELSKNLFLLGALASVADSYDYIIIDTPPARDILTRMALVSSDYVIIPCRCDDFSVEGMENTYGMMQDMAKEEDTDIKLLGIVLTMVEKTTLTKVFYDAFEESDFKNDLFETRIRKGQAVVDSIRLGGPVVIKSPSSAPAKDYVSLYEEIKKRMTKMERQSKQGRGA